MLFLPLKMCVFTSEGKTNMLTDMIFFSKYTTVFLLWLREALTAFLSAFSKTITITMTTPSDSYHRS